MRSEIGKKTNFSKETEQVSVRRCARAGCQQDSAFTLAFDYSKAEVWLCDLWGEVGAGSYDLCVAHAERFKAPLGWSYSDKRDATPPVYGERAGARATLEQLREEGSHRATA